MKALFVLLVAVLFVFLLAPVLLVFPMSFSADTFISWPPSGWSLRWYSALLHQDDLIDAFSASVMLALIATAGSLLMGMGAVVSLRRGDAPGRETILALLTAPLLLPSIVIGLALLMVFSSRGLVGTWAGLIPAHLLVTLPYVVRILLTSLSTLPDSIADAGGSLGAAPLRVFLLVTLPLMLPGLIAAAAVAFLISFDEVIVTLFLVGPQLTTLPVALYHFVVMVVVDRAMGLARAMSAPP
jgi:putative spermidine/putrescine transport system permease protein